MHGPRAREGVFAVARLAVALMVIVCPARPLAASAGAPEALLPSFFDEEVARFTRLAHSGVPELQIEAAQGFRNLRHGRGEAPLLPLADSAHVEVRLEAVKALGVCGARRAVAKLVERLADTEWEVRANAHDALTRMTGNTHFPPDSARWRAWLDRSNWPAKEALLLRRLEAKDPQAAAAALRALRFVGSGAAEDAVLRRGPHIARVGPRLTCLALERIGTKKSLPLLTRLAPHVPEACWALAEIGGAACEDAVLKSLARFRIYRLDALVNLDRLHSARAGPMLPILLEAFGLVIFRSWPDELHMEPTAFQRAAANLILRTGQSQKVVDLILAEAEGRRKDADTPPPLRPVLAAMRKELRPGFVRSDGKTVAQPLAALPHIIRDRRFVPRLIALLNHRAFLVRIYAAHALASLKAPEAVAPILAVIRRPYGFVDATTLASGKHFGRSQTVRWRGYLCMALGRLGGPDARQALETLALDAASYRDIRYGSVVGLKFLCSPASLAALRRIAQQDIIRQIRRTAREAITEIELSQKLAAPAKTSGGPR